MAVMGSTSVTASRWTMWAFWAAGVALLLVEMNAAMEYLEAGLQHNVGSLLGWAPAMGIITLKMAEQSIWHWGTLVPALQALSMGALGVLLVGLGLAFTRRASARERIAKQ